MSKLSRLISRILPQKVERKVRMFRDINLRKIREEKLPKKIYDPRLRKFSISFCTTCMNRLFHLEHTIEKNIADNASYPNVEFVLIDYNSKDGLGGFAKKKLQKYIDSGKLNYYKTYEPKKFHMSKAKNLAHRLAKGDIFCNLDGDNYTGKDYAYYINYLFNKGFNYLYQFHTPPFWGTVGRICLSRENFYLLGGYDESFSPTGHDDIDFIDRAKGLGLIYKRIEVKNFLKYLSNTTLEKSINCTDQVEDYYEHEESNRQISLKNLENGLFKANQGGMEKYTVYKNFNKTPIKVGLTTDLLSFNNKQQ